MRPYLAIIKDSFRAAMASRVLYVLLLLITLLLVALAPLHLDESLDWRLGSDINVHKPDALIRKIVTDRETSPAVVRVWSMLPGSLQKEMIAMAGQATTNRQAKPGAQQQEVLKNLFTQERLIEKLNEIISQPDFYHPEDPKPRD